MALRSLALAALLALLCGCAAAPRYEPPPPQHALPIGDSAFLDHEVKRELAGKPGVSGVRLATQNPLALAYRLETARRAERSLDVQYYIWHYDFTGRLLAAELLAAAERGVRVRLLLDDLDLNDQRALLQAADQHPNLQVRVFNPLYSAGSLPAKIGEFLQRGLRLNHRMHNKLWIADNRVAIVGGRNIGDEYFGASAHANFSDTGLIVGGPAVAQASAAFDAYWNSAVVVPVAALGGRAQAPESLASLQARAGDFRSRAGELPLAAALDSAGELAEYLARRPPPLEASDVRIIADDPEKMVSGARGREASRVLDGVYDMIEQSRHEVLIVSPYFVPGPEGTGYLLATVKRGVRVAVLTNSLAATDVAGVHAGYSRYRKALLAGGVELYEMKRQAGDETERKRLSLTGSSQASLHTKAVVADGRRVMIGSMNLDPRSVNINTEIGAFLDSPGLAAQLVQRFANETAPSMSYRVRLEADGRLAWHDSVDGAARVTRKEPEADALQRLKVLLFRLLPLESQL